MDTIFNSPSYLQFRLDSFKESPFDTKRVKCTQKKLAESGFYYTPSEEHPDSVTCYACGVRLHGWNKKSDDPWTKHAEENPNCVYLLKKETYANELTVVDFIEIEKSKYLRLNDINYQEKKESMDKVVNELKKMCEVETLGAKEIDV